MSIRVNDALELEPGILEKAGAFNAFVDIDSQFHLDPHLLSESSVPEMSGSYDSFINYFKNINSLFEASQKAGDRFFNKAVSLLTFKELPYVGLGYSKSGVKGRGIGPELARRIADTAFDIVRAGIKDPVIFELMGLFEDKIGADRISDMTVRIILRHLIEFSGRLAKELKTSTVSIDVGNDQFFLPFDKVNKQPIILIPCDILHPLPVAYDWEDIDYVCKYNAALRSRVNQIIGDNWKKAIKLKKSYLKGFLVRNPEVLKDLLSQYKEKPAREYDFSKDPLGELIWYEISDQFTRKYPLSLKYELSSPGDVYQVVKSICGQFKELVENNGLFAVFYDDQKKLRHERFAQLLFFGIADSYCKSNNLDLSRESNAGRGPVDFKISKGYFARVNVEIKYSSNSVINGYQKQLPIYNQAEKTKYSIYLVIRTTESDKQIKDLLALKSKEEKNGARVPDIVVVDGRYLKSASRVRY